jgi:hypothetical protein
MTCKVTLIDKPALYPILDELLAIPRHEFLGLNIQMKASHIDKKTAIVKDYPPSLLTICLINKAYVIDLLAC